MTLENHIDYDGLRLLGLNIIPCKPMSKQPLINWLEYQEKTCSLPLDKNNNAAVICGRTSGDLVVIDIDVPEKLDRFFSDFESVKKNTLVVKTGSGGYHIYMRVLDKLPKIMQMVDEIGNPMGEIRGQGGYVISPGSTHPNGNKYEIISDTTNINTFHIENLIKGLSSRGINVKKTLPPVEEIVKGVPLGNRDNATYKYTAHLKSTVGLDKDTAWIEIQRWAESIGHNCKKEKLRSTFESAWKRVPNPILDEIDLEENSSDDVLANGSPLPKYANDLKDVHALVGDKILSLNHYASIPATNEIYVFENGVYKKYEIGINELTNKMIKSAKESNRREVFNYVKSHVERTYDEFDKDPNIHNLQNGLLNIETMELKQHTPEYLSLRQFGVKYIENATCPEFDQALIDNLPNPKQRQLFLEGMAMCLIPEEKKFKKCMMVFGPSNSGKSFLITQLEKILGGSVKDEKDNNNEKEGYIASYGIQDFDNTRWACGGLIGKFANITHDMGHHKVKDSHVFKNIIDHKPVPSEKKHGQLQNIAHKVACIFLSNQLPEVVAEASEGFFSRIILIIFTKVYQDDLTPEQVEQGYNPIDRERVKKIENETPGIYLKLLQIAKEIKKNGKLSHVPAPEETERLWNEYQNPLTWFTDMTIDRTYEEADYVFMSDLYKDYVEKCRTLLPVRSPETETRFSLNLSRIYTKSDREDPRFKEPHEHHKVCFVGIKIKSDYVRHDNLNSKDSSLKTTLGLARDRGFEFTKTNGKLKCLKCGELFDLVSFKEHTSDKCAQSEGMKKQDNS